MKQSQLDEANFVTANIKENEAGLFTKSMIQRMSVSENSSDEN